jgi:hypothetical protein
MKELPFPHARPPLRYDETCNRQNCGQPSTHGCSIRQGRAEVHFGLAVCSTCAPEMTLDDLVPASMWDEFVPLLRAFGEPWPVRTKCRVHLTPMDGSST